MSSKRTILTLAIFALSATALAHDPSQHASEGAPPPDCSKMSEQTKGMDGSDPVMRAMHEKCMGHMHDGSENADTHHEHDSSNDHSPTRADSDRSNEDHE